MKKPMLLLVAAIAFASLAFEVVTKVPIDFEIFVEVYFGGFLLLLFIEENIGHINVRWRRKKPFLLPAAQASTISSAKQMAAKSIETRS